MIRIIADIEGTQELYDYINKSKLKGKVTIHTCTNNEMKSCVISKTDGVEIA